MIIATITLVSFLGNYVLAAEEMPLLNEEVQEIINDGRIEIVFVESDSDDYEELYYSSPVQGITIELYFRYNKEMTNVYEIEDFQNVYLNLTSNENGRIIIEGVPYGRYEYRIVSAPTGCIYIPDNKLVQVTPSQNETIKYDPVQFEEYVYSPEVEETPPVREEIPVETPVEEIPVEEVHVEETPKEEINEIVNVETQNINTLANTMFEIKVEDTKVQQHQLEVELPKTDIEKQVVEVTKVLQEKYDRRVSARLEAMRHIPITDTIKIAIAQVDSTIHFIDLLTDMPENDKGKKLLNHNNRHHRLAFDTYREYKNSRYLEIVAKIRR